MSFYGIYYSFQEFYLKCPNRISYVMIPPISPPTQGSVSKEITEYAEDHNIDIIVVGTRGMTGIKKILLGSIASDIVTYAHCPVLVIK